MAAGLPNTGGDNALMQSWIKALADMMKPTQPAQAAGPTAQAPADAARPANNIDALMGDNVQHPGWNPGEAGPPMSPDFVRNPKSDADWIARYNFFAEGENWKMLDPRWRPVNMEYQKNDPKSIAYLQDLAAGRVPQDQVAWDWDPAKAMRQLQAWGKIPASTGGNSAPAPTGPSTPAAPKTPATSPTGKPSIPQQVQPGALTGPFPGGVGPLGGPGGPAGPQSYPTYYSNGAPKGQGNSVYPLNKYGPGFGHSFDDFKWPWQK